MSNDLMLDVGQANELKLAFRRANYSNGDIKRLCEGNVLTDVRRVLLGYAVINLVEPVIDCDAQPYLAVGWSVEEHQKGGVYKWNKDTQKDALYLSKRQAGSKYIQGSKLRKELTEKNTPVLNANALDYLLVNLHLIPEEWKGKHVFFWGTVYRSDIGRLFVRFLYWNGSRWGWNDRWLGNDFGNLCPAAVRAS